MATPDPALTWKRCRNGHTGAMMRHPSKPNSLLCVVCRKIRDGEQYRRKRKALVQIYSRLLIETQCMSVGSGGPRMARLEVMRTLRKKLLNLGVPPKTIAKLEVTDDGCSHTDRFTGKSASP